jgi:hypothetical protein
MRFIRLIILSKFYSRRTLCFGSLVIALPTGHLVDLAVQEVRPAAPRAAPAADVRACRRRQVGALHHLHSVAAECQRVARVSVQSTAYYETGHSCGCPCHGCREWSVVFGCVPLRAVILHLQTKRRTTTHSIVRHSGDPVVRIAPLGWCPSRPSCHGVWRLGRGVVVVSQLESSGRCHLTVSTAPRAVGSFHPIVIPCSGCQPSISVTSRIGRQSGSYHYPRNIVG